MPYPAAFALHLTAVILFAGVLLLTAAALPALAPGSPEAGRLRALNLWVASPALLALWTFGLVMAVEAGWFAMGWLRVKLVLVLALSALHGRQMAALRRLRAGEPVRAGRAPLALAAAAIAAVALLAAAKPF